TAGNIGELTNARFPVPPGFCVATTGYALVAADAGLQSVLDTHATSQAGEGGDAQRLTDMAQAARHCLLAAPIPTEIADAITGAYGILGSGEPIPVAVRSSATAEDLPYASFAGQQDTYLNVVGADAVLDAVRRCWASLWTDRAVSYRAKGGIDHRAVRLAVALQRMVDARVAGILFTANPLTGRRRRALADPGAADHHPLPAAGRRPRGRPRPAGLLLAQRRPGRLPAAHPDGPAGLPAAGLGHRRARRLAAPRPVRRPRRRRGGG